MKRSFFYTTCILLLCLGRVCAQPVSDVVVAQNGGNALGLTSNFSTYDCVWLENAMDVRQQNLRAVAWMDANGTSDFIATGITPAFNNWVSTPYTLSDFAYPNVMIAGPISGVNYLCVVYRALDAASNTNQVFLDIWNFTSGLCVRTARLSDPNITTDVGVIHVDMLAEEDGNNDPFAEDFYVVWEDMGVPIGMTEHGVSVFYGFDIPGLISNGVVLAGMNDNSDRVSSSSNTGNGGISTTYPCLDIAGFTVTPGGLDAAMILFKHTNGKLLYSMWGSGSTTQVDNSVNITYARVDAMDPYEHFSDFAPDSHFEIVYNKSDAIYSYNNYSLSEEISDGLAAKGYPVMAGAQPVVTCGPKTDGSYGVFFPVDGDYLVMERVWAYTGYLQEDTAWMVTTSNRATGPQAACNDWTYHAPSVDGLLPETVYVCWYEASNQDIYCTENDGAPFPDFKPLNAASVSSEGGWRMYPNPVGNMLHLDCLNWRDGQDKYQLLDITGRVVQKGLLHRDKNRLDISGLSPGLYLVDIEGGDRLNLIKN